MFRLRCTKWLPASTAVTDEFGAGDGQDPQSALKDWRADKLSVGTGVARM